MFLFLFVCFKKENQYVYGIYYYENTIVEFYCLHHLIIHAYMLLVNQLCCCLYISQLWLLVGQRRNWHYTYISLWIMPFILVLFFLNFLDMVTLGNKHPHWFFRKKLSSLEKDRMDMRSTIDALQEGIFSPLSCPTMAISQC